LARIALYYGSNEGNTAYAAEQIKEAFDAFEQDVVKIFNIATATIDDLAKWDYLILGISTWDIGQLQDDWDIFLPRMDELNMRGKKVAVYGLGDQYGYPDTFVDAVGVLADVVLQQGGELYGLWPAGEYQFTGSVASIEDHLLGLALDIENEAGKSEARVKKWVDQLAWAWGIGQYAREGV
jgi:flavodoxin I